MRAITTALLANAGTIIRSTFTDAMMDVANKVPIFWPDIATKVQSNDLKEIYGRLSGLPGYRKWIGPRVVHRMQAGDYTVFNDKYELTVAIPGDDLRFDKLGLRTWMASQQGARARQLPDTLVWEAVNSGFTAKGPDGVEFFSDSHPILDKNGQDATFSNLEAGAGPAWYLTASMPGMAPILLQEVFTPNLVERFDPTDPRVFDNDEFVWGSWAMYGAGYFLPSMIQASKAALDETGFNAAYDDFSARVLDGEAKQGILPTDLWVPTSLRSAGEKLVQAINLANGATNTNAGKCTLRVIPYLSNS